MELITYLQIIGGILVVLIIIYSLIGNFGYMRGFLGCLTFKNLLLGQWGSCFRAYPAKTCQGLEHGYVYGWCNDLHEGQPIGAMAGTKTGPYTGSCTDWIWNKDDCEPSQCKDIQEQCLGSRQWGWCADKGNERAMKGKASGPSGGQKC